MSASAERRGGAERGEGGGEEEWARGGRCFPYPDSGDLLLALLIWLIFIVQPACVLDFDRVSLGWSGHLVAFLQELLGDTHASVIRA
jgi:hypothetical protein